MLEDLDVDRPPAGTECVSCRAGGHFCPATLYIGDTDIGICQPCRDGSDCPRFKVVHSEPTPLFEPEETASASSPVKIIPPEEWPADTSIHEQKHDIADVPFGLRNEVREEQKSHAPSPLQTSPKAQWKVVPKPAGNRIPDGTRHLIASEPIEIRDFEIGQKYGCSAASVLNIRREAGLEIPVRNRGPRAAYKTKKREIAKTLLLEGKSVRKAAAEDGISTNTVRLAKAEIPSEQLPPAPVGGFHAHQKQREYLERDCAVTDKIVQPEHRNVPQPEEVLLLAEEIVEARSILAELEARWKAFFVLR